MKKVRAYQYVDEEIKYTEDYTIGKNGDYVSIEDLKADLNELVCSAIDRYEIEEIQKGGSNNDHI